MASFRMMKCIIQTPIYFASIKIHYIAEVTCKMLVLVKFIYSIVKVKSERENCGMSRNQNGDNYSHRMRNKEGISN